MFIFQLATASKGDVATIQPKPGVADKFESRSPTIYLNLMSSAFFILFLTDFKEFSAFFFSSKYSKESEYANFDFCFCWLCILTLTVDAFLSWDFCLCRPAGFFTGCLGSKTFPLRLSFWPRAIQSAGISNSTNAINFLHIISQLKAAENLRKQKLVKLKRLIFDLQKTLKFAS